MFGREREREACGAVLLRVVFELFPKIPILAILQIPVVNGFPSSPARPQGQRSRSVGVAVASLPMSRRFMVIRTWLTMLLLEWRAMCNDGGIGFSFLGSGGRMTGFSAR